MSKFWSLAALVVGALIVTDLITHPNGTATAFSGVTNLESTVGNQITGSSATDAKSVGKAAA